MKQSLVFAGTTEGRQLIEQLRCHEANIAKNPEIMEEVLKHLRSMRDNWKEVMKKVSGDKSNPQAQAKIAGSQRGAGGYTISNIAAMRQTGT